MRSGGRSARAPSGWIAATPPTSAINSRRLTILSRSLTNQKSLAYIGAALALHVFLCRPVQRELASSVFPKKDGCPLCAHKQSFDTK
jgi:hypothetical protein